MKRAKIFTVILSLCMLAMLAACGRGGDTPAADIPSEPVHELQCSRPGSISGLYSPGGSALAVCSTDYDAGTTTMQLIDAAADKILCEQTLDGAWSLKDQRFADGRLALYSIDRCEWLFLGSGLDELGRLGVPSTDGFFSCDCSAYYYLDDGVIYCLNTADGTNGAVSLSHELRFLELSAFDNQNGRLLAQFYLSPYGSECGTAMLDMASGQVVMLQAERYQPVFTDGGLCLMQFDSDSMGYSALYGSDSFMFANAGIFGSADLYGVDGAPYLISAAGGTTLFSLHDSVSACRLGDFGIAGEMYYSCWLPDENVLIGAVYSGDAFQLYAIAPALLTFTPAADAAPADSPIAVDESLALSYSRTLSSAPIAADLNAAREYADELEDRYGVGILLSSQCREAAELCDRTITLTDTMDADDELGSINTALDALARVLSLYPDGFFAQFKNGAGDGGVLFLLVGSIDSSYGVIGCTYENYLWQYIALDVRMSNSLDSLICHEIWHATENHILSQNYAAFPQDAWAALNPAGFEYYGDASLSDPDQQHWTLYDNSGDGVYFVDSYGRVDEREDRARIMEYFMVHDDEARLLIESPAIRQKLQMMCDAIRSYFDTTGWGALRWESLL